jgi:predicted ATPase/DNA-binding SARP family transcriptional activator
MTARLDFRLLGPLEVRDGAQSLSLGGRKQRSLLAILLLHANEVVSDDLLIEGLWGERPPKTAPAALQVHVSALRKLLSAERLERRASGYVLHLEPDELDLARFERLCAQARDFEPEAAAAALAEALSLWRGRPLADFAYESFAQGEIARLEELRLAALEQRIDAELALGRHAELVGELEVLVGEHPLRERLREQQILALYRCRRQAEALEAYRQAREMLVEELGIEPSPALRELERGVLAQDAALEAPAAPPIPEEKGTSVQSDNATQRVPELPSGTVTLLFTDVEASTRLLRQLGRDGYIEALGAHRRFLREAFSDQGGIEIEIQSERVHIAFSTASDAVEAAAAGQRALAGHAWPVEPLRVRMGLHSGSPELADNLYAGLDVHRTAAITDAAHGGQILLSQATQVLLAGDLPAGASLRDVGRHMLKDLLEPQHLYELEIEGLETEFPPLRTLENRRTNLPVQPTPLVGRQRELAELIELASSERLLTLTGAGGSGKTRLALQTAAELVEGYPDGVWWVPLAALRDPEFVEPTIAQVVGAKDGVAEHLHDHRALLLLDNFEQLIEAAPRIAALLAEAPGLHVLATSRERLGIAAEQEYPVPTMGLDEAVALFAARAVRLRPGFEPDESIAEICRRLDGLPLAIELAAARIKLLPPAQILARLEHSLELLTGGARDAPERQRTLRATIETSYALLSDDERRVFRRLAVFAGGGTLQAAGEVCGADLDILSSLLDKSLIGENGERFTMLETIREYAAASLDDFEAEEVHRRHAEWFAKLAEEASARLVTAEQAAWLERLEREHDNLRAALRWSLKGKDPGPGLRLCIALRRFWLPHGHFVEAGRWLGLAISRLDGAPPDLQGPVLVEAGYLALTVGDNDRAQELLDQAMAIAKASGDQATQVDAFRSLAILSRARDDLEGAIGLAEQALALRRGLGDDAATSVVLHQLANFLRDAGDAPRAQELFEESIQLARESGDLYAAANFMHSLGDLALDVGDLDRAQELYGESLELARRFEADWVAASCLAGLAAVFAARGELELAARLWGAVEALESRLGISAMLPSMQARYTEVVRPACEEAPAAVAAGRELDLAEAAAAWTDGERAGGSTGARG